MKIKFENLINADNGEVLEIEVPDDYDVSGMEEAGRLGREAAEGIKKAINAGELAD